MLTGEDGEVRKQLRGGDLFQWWFKASWVGFAAWVMCGHCLWGLAATPGVRTAGCFPSLDVPTSSAERGVAGSHLHPSENTAGFTAPNLFFLRRGQGSWTPQRKS